jgi:hypothetical protein
VVNACSDDCNMQEGELSHLLVSLWITIIWASFELCMI